KRLERDKADGIGEKEISASLNKAKKSRKKYMDMYEADIITLDELKEKTYSLNKEIEKLNNEMNIYTGGKTYEQIDKAFYTMFNNLEMLLKEDTLTNAMLAKIIDCITVDEFGKVDIYFKAVREFPAGINVPFYYNRT
ncbi:hypothetical protein LJB89_01200, partial [Tyzzerella sp. OttesenSCG-928-J15]|nr:hypothetical protein [Tyzzerella sp. OttesenSCG-928-J15]